MLITWPQFRLICAFSSGKLVVRRGSSVEKCLSALSPEMFYQAFKLTCKFSTALRILGIPRALSESQLACQVSSLHSTKNQKLDSTRPV